MSRFKKSYGKWAVNRKNQYDCGSGKEGNKGFQPGNTCGGNGDGKDTSADQGGKDKPKGWDEAKAKIGEHITGQYGEMDKPQYYPYIDEFYAPFKDENGNFTAEGLNEAWEALDEATGGDAESGTEAIAVEILNQGKLPDDMPQEELEQWGDTLGDMYGQDQANEILANSPDVLGIREPEGGELPPITGAGDGGITDQQIGDWKKRIGKADHEWVDDVVNDTEEGVLERIHAFAISPGFPKKLQQVTKDIAEARGIDVGSFEAKTRTERFGPTRGGEWDEINRKESEELRNLIDKAGKK